MKSFPSSLNESKSSLGISNTAKYEKAFDLDRIKSGALNLNKTAPVVQELLKPQNINISNYQGYQQMYYVDNPKHMASLDSNTSRSPEDQPVYYENPLELPADIIALAKDYEWVYKNGLQTLIGVNRKKDQATATVATTSLSPSMFNPMYGVVVKGITANTPLLNDVTDKTLNPKIGDCSIRTLCALSKQKQSELGQARYKYADFMYCKDLGKIPNNHLITLRKFPFPVGDNIFEETGPKFYRGKYGYQMPGDVGRMITWFGTEENKLENICKYDFHATWKPLESQIEQKETTADDQSTGFIGLLENSFGAGYNSGVAAGSVGTHNIWTKLASTVAGNIPIVGKNLDPTQGIGKNNELLRNYDRNKVYTPRNTIQSTHIYEGNLLFNQQFDLTFTYQLKAYDNINPRSAMLDLLGNILEVTYRRGVFWGGSRKIIGPAQDTSLYHKVSSIVDKSFDGLGDFFNGLASGSITMNSLLGSLSSSVKNFLNGVKEVTKNPSDALNNLTGALKNAVSGANITGAAKGLILNALGRPTLYAWQSLLSGDPVGLWHVTIGNPRNPILAIGNLILENTQVIQSGPLGLDDFPTELKVIVTLKHAKPRDVVDISRMYTRGASAIYQPLGKNNISRFFGKSDNYITPNNEKDVNKLVEQETQNIMQEPDEDTEFFTNGLSNPFLTTNDEVRINRTNNWSNTMFSMAMQEIA